MTHLGGDALGCEFNQITFLDGQVLASRNWRDSLRIIQFFPNQVND